MLPARRRTSQRRREVAAAELGHELRTPLTAILGFAQLLAADAERPADAERLAQIIRAGRHLLAIIDEVEDPDQLPEPLELEAVALAPLCARVCEMMRPIAGEREVRLELAVPAHAHVRADAQRLTQVLINLVSNAVKYNHRRGRVQIGTAADDGSWRISVADSGPGIPFAERARVFTPFERLGADHDEIGGAGIGLALCRDYVEAMGGAIGLDGEARQGACFWVVLPSAAVLDSAVA